MVNVCQCALINGPSNYQGLDVVTIAIQFALEWKGKEEKKRQEDIGKLKPWILLFYEKTFNTWKLHENVML